MEAVQSCKSVGGLCKGAKLNTKIGRGVAMPRPPMVEDKAKPCPYPRAEPARGMLGWHAVPTLPKAARSIRRAAGGGALGWTTRGCPLRSDGPSRLKLRSLNAPSIYRSQVRCKGPSSVTRALGSSSVRIAEEVVFRQKLPNGRWDFQVPPSDENRVLVCIGGQGEALPLPAGDARERQLGQHAVLP
jgi:hypothetical protein